jgi:hypothetical protein
MAKPPTSWGQHVADGGYRTLGMSFESGQQNTARVYFNERVRITRLRGEVTKALAGTDAGTVTPKDSAGNTMTGGTLTFAASAALNNRQTGAPTANNVVAAGDFLDLVAAKTTAGGTAQVYVEYTIEP